MDVPLADFVGGGRNEADDMRLAQPGCRGGDAEVAIQRIGPQAVGLEVALRSGG